MTVVPTKMRHLLQKNYNATHCVRLFNGVSITWPQYINTIIKWLNRYAGKNSATCMDSSYTMSTENIVHLLTNNNIIIPANTQNKSSNSLSDHGYTLLHDAKCGVIQHDKKIEQRLIKHPCFKGSAVIAISVLRHLNLKPHKGNVNGHA